MHRHTSSKIASRGIIIALVNPGHPPEQKYCKCNHLKVTWWDWWERRYYSMQFITMVSQLIVIYLPAHASLHYCLFGASNPTYYDEEPTSLHKTKASIPFQKKNRETDLPTPHTTKRRRDDSTFRRRDHHKTDRRRTHRHNKVSAWSLSWHIRHWNNIAAAQ